MDRDFDPIRLDKLLELVTDLVAGMRSAVLLLAVCALLLGLILWRVA